jgi:two-component system CheB/CheR fusion protein
MQRLIEDVLTLSKLSNRTQEFEAVDLNQVLQMIKDDLEITVKEKEAKIKVGKLPVINGIGGQMHQVFQNLISNALKFTNGARPEIEITHRELKNNEAKEMKLRPGNYHCITVRDNGIGFEEVYKDKIFGLFQRLNGSEYDGTGIGLAICKKIMENHNGYIIAESKPNKGSEFNIIITQKQVLQPEPQNFN